MAALITAIPDLRGLRSKITAAACAFFDVGGRDRADAYTTAKPPRLDTLSFSNEQRSTFLTNFLHDAPSTVYKEKMPSPKSHLSLPRVAARRTHISLQQLMTCGRSLRSHGRNRFDSDQRDDHDPAQRRARLTPPASGARPTPPAALHIAHVSAVWSATSNSARSVKSADTRSFAPIASAAASTFRRISACKSGSGWDCCSMRDPSRLHAARCN